MDIKIEKGSEKAYSFYFVGKTCGKVMKFRGKTILWGRPVEKS